MVFICVIIVLFSYKMGRGNDPEIPGKDPCVVHVYYDHIPDVLKSPIATSRTKWIFLSSFATTKEEALAAYKKGISMMMLIVTKLVYNMCLHIVVDYNSHKNIGSMQFNYKIVIA